jgi:N-dimethylarginine dimethylaminohydrolase
MATYRQVREIDFALSELPTLPQPTRVLMADPAAFDVESALNPHMVDASGRLKRVDRARAREQWLALRRTFEGLGLAVDVVAPLDRQPDLVFCANQTLPIPAAATRDGRARVVPSNMAHAERRGEVEHVARELARQGYSLEPLRTSERIEGMGDGLWHVGRRLLWAGCGPRSSPAAWSEIAERFDLPVILLDLVARDFYHLDTCLALLDEHTCLWRPSALAPHSRELVRHLFPRAIEADEHEATTLLACNAFCPDSRHVILQRGATKTIAALRSAGFTPLEVDTTEFLKSGGSVFCMKLFHTPPNT